MFIHVVYSVWRLLAASVLSLAVGIPLGLFAGTFPPANKFVTPVIYALAPVPKIALLPLVMLMFGIGEMSKIFLIFLVMVFQIALSAAGAATRVPEEYYVPFRAAGFSKLFMIRRILLPSVLPELLTALKTGLATGVSVLFFAETYGTRFGLGFYIMDNWLRLEYGRMAAGICVLGLVGFTCAAVTDLLERRVNRWKR